MNVKRNLSVGPKMSRSRGLLYTLATFCVLVSAPAVAAQMTCSISEKHHCETGSGCQRMVNTISVRIDRDRKTYSRCDESGCDTFEVQISQSGDFYNINLANVLAKVSTVDRSLVEVATFDLRTYVSFGACRDAGQ